MSKLTMTATLIDRGSLGGVPGSSFDRRIKTFTAAVKTARAEAAQTATTVSRGSVKRVRDLGPQRAGRFHGLADALRWRAVGTESDGVGLALTELNQKFPPWLVQEIGTNERATQKVAGKPNPQGRPTKGAAYIKTVKSQKGRRISNAFVFATQAGQYSPPGASRTQQLHLRSAVKGAPVRFDPKTRRAAPGIRISKEINGQHFVKKGGEAGFREFEGKVLAAARSQLRKRRT